jgi:hypothetical protein
MRPGSAKSAIDSTVESIPTRWMQAFKPSEDLDDIMRVCGPSEIISQHGDYLIGIVDDGTKHLEPRWNHKMPMDMGVMLYRVGANNLAVRAAVNDIVGAYDSIVDYVMVWSKKMGYDTCRGRLPAWDGTGDDVDPFEFSALDGDLAEEFFYEIVDREFYLAVSRWVAEEFLKRKIITPNSVNMLVTRAKDQP